MIIPLLAGLNTIENVGKDCARCRQTPKQTKRTPPLTWLQRHIVIEPWPRGVTPTRRVDIDVDYFIGSLGGDLRLGGQYQLVEATTPSAAAITTFDYTETLDAPTYAALVAGHSLALNRLAEDIAQELAAGGS